MDGIVYEIRTQKQKIFTILLSLGYLYEMNQIIKKQLTGEKKFSLKYLHEANWMQSRSTWSEIFVRENEVNFPSSKGSGFFPMASERNYL